jgi:hypothetical protein
MIDYLSAIAGGIIFGWYAREWYAMRKVEKLMDSFGDNMLDEFKKKVIDITIEKSGDLFYVYRKDDGTFLAQGTDIEKLSDILVEKFPGKLFNCSPEDLAALEATK